VRGLFVTLTKHKRLRGCMGNILGTHPLAEGVAVQALVSAFDDPRFPPVGADEMGEIDIEISVLTPLAPVAGPDEIEVGRHGVLLEKHGHRAVFLPQVATEQGWNRDTFLSQLCRKAGLGPDEWRSGAKLEVFEAQVFGEGKHS
jgi:AmmeMemoRadiSam system protein A